MSLLSTNVDDRRKWPRIPIADGNLFIQWQNEDKVIGLNAVLIDISQGGAMVMSPVLIPKNQIIQVALKVGAPKTWLSAVVVGVIESRRWNQIRLEFRKPCPDPILQAALGQCVAEESCDDLITADIAS